MRPLFPLLSFFLLASACSSSGGEKSGAQEPLLPVLPWGEVAELSPATSAAKVFVPTLQPGDVLDIRVYGNPDLDMLQLRVPENGSISYPLIGPIVVGGRTVSELEGVIREKLASEFLQDPQVTVVTREYSPRKVYILGGVRNPAGYLLPPTEHLTLFQLIAAAGGYTDRAYKEYVQVIRRVSETKREVIALSLTEIEKALAKGHTEADIDLFPDDVVVIPSVARMVYVLGAVKSPGSFEIPTDTRMSVSQAVSRAGSYTKFASIGKILVLRQTPGGQPKKIAVDLGEIVNGKLELDVELVPGDVVWVPERGVF